MFGCKPSTGAARPGAGTRTSIGAPLVNRTGPVGSVTLVSRGGFRTLTNAQAATLSTSVAAAAKSHAGRLVRDARVRPRALMRPHMRNVAAGVVVSRNESLMGIES